MRRLVSGTETTGILRQCRQGSHYHFGGRHIVELLADSVALR
jgi:hypothetical protein